MEDLQTNSELHQCRLRSADLPSDKGLRHVAAVIRPLSYM
jgi:hypothetical protein